MLKMDQYEMIRTAHRVYGKSIRQLSREFGHHRSTIRKALEEPSPAYQRTTSRESPVMDAVAPIIRQWLAEDQSRPKKQRHTAHRIYERLTREYGFCGAESTVRRWVMLYKREMGYEASTAVLPLDPDVSREGEVDWGVARVELGGDVCDVKLFCMRSRYSGAIFAKAYPGERQEMFFDGHVRAFDYFGGVFPVLVYDNLTAAVKKVLRGKRRIEQDEFIRFRAYHTFEARFCGPGRGNEKGGVEGAVGYSRRNFMVPVPKVADFDELNRRLLESCYEHRSKVLGGREDRRPIEERFIEERSRLLSLPDKAFDHMKMIPVRIDRYQTARVDGNRYSVPTAYVGVDAMVHLGCWTVGIYANEKRIAEHRRVFGRNEWRLEPMHYLNLLRKRIGAFDSARVIVEWKKTWPESYRYMLAKLVSIHGENEGKREFVDILRLHHDHNGDDVDSCIREATQRGAFSFEAVKQLLLRRTRPKPQIETLPENLIPGVTDRTIPSADVERYGALLEGERP